MADKATASSVKKAAPAPRLLVLDQLRGWAMATMLFVNLNFGYTILPPFFTHGVTYTSGPDLVMPLFHFCVGYALRLALLRRLKTITRKEAFKQLLQVRVPGLILCSMFLSDGWGEYTSWSALSGFGQWLRELVQNPQPYHTLLHIAFVSIYTFYPMTLPARFRVYQLVGTCLLHTLFLATFYFGWMRTYDLDEGGYFGFLGWSITTLIGSLVHDAVDYVHSLEETQVAVPAPAIQAQTFADSTAPLLSLYASENSINTSASASKWSWKRLVGGRRSLFLVTFIVSWVLMFFAYLLSCMGRVIPFTVCYDSQRPLMGGFGNIVPCPTVSDGASFWVESPLVLPDPATHVVTMWTMTQRAGTVPYHLFTSGTSLLMFSLLYWATEIGWKKPQWWPTTIAEAVFGIRAKVPTLNNRLFLHWHFLEVLGENSLAVYLISNAASDYFNQMLPPDCPAWYFLLWGELLYMGFIYIAARYLRSQKLFLRL